MQSTRLSSPTRTRCAVNPQTIVTTTPHTAPIPAQQTADHADMVTKTSFLTLLVGSIGVVYGDIGTSPLYAFREAVLAASGGTGTAQPAMVYGILSLIIWALLLIVTFKYVFILLLADNRGEGGTMAIMSLAQRSLKHHSNTVMVIGVIGAALFVGDAMLTPAISVLSAVEGLKLVTPVFEPYVVPISIAIIVALFATQSAGTAVMSGLFGPITLLWFVAIGLSGAAQIAENPAILGAINPAYAFNFLIAQPYIGLLTLGAVFLAVTGAEALYADLGHFGRKPIQVAWIIVVLPALTINYLGQGALVLADPAAIENPFFRLVPQWLLLPMVVLATAATVIASQAVITGAFSLVRQSMQLGFLPRLTVKQTSAEIRGQI